MQRGVEMHPAHKIGMMDNIIVTKTVMLSLMCLSNIFDIIIKK